MRHGPAPTRLLRIVLLVLAAGALALLFAAATLHVRPARGAIDLSRAAVERRAGSAQVGIRLECDRPRALRLQRFEDGSARLRCGFRTLARIGTPG